MRQPPSPLGPLTPHTLPLSRCWCCRSCLFIMQKAISSGRHCGQRHQAGQSHHLQVGSNNHGVCPGRAASAGNSTSAGKPHRAWYAAACRGHMGGLAARGSQHGARPTASQPASLLAALTCHILHSMGWGRLVGKAIRAYRSAAACRPALRACQRCPPARPPPPPPGSQKLTTTEARVVAALAAALACIAAVGVDPQEAWENAHCCRRSQRIGTLRAGGGTAGREAEGATWRCAHPQLRVQALDPCQGGLLT